jgi:hypothetical protein
MMSAVGSAVQPAIQGIAQKTGLPAQDVGNMAGTLGFAAPGAVGSAVRGVRAPMSAMADRFAQMRDGALPQQYASGPVGSTGRPSVQSVSPSVGASSGANAVGAAGADLSTMATASGASPEVVAAIRQSEVTGKPINPIGSARQIEASSLPVPIKLMRGEASGDVNYLSREKNIRGNNPEVATLMNERNADIVRNFDAIKEQAAPDVYATGHDVNQAAVDAYKTMDAGKRAAISADYQAIEDANGGKFPLNGKDFSDAAIKALEKDDDIAFLPAEIRGLIDKYAQGADFTVSKFESLRTKLATAQRAAHDGNVKHSIGIVANTLEALPMSEEAAALKPLADKARASAKARFDLRRADPAYEAAINDGVAIGEPSPVAQNFLRTYAIKGSPAAVQNMVRNLSNDPHNQQLLAAGTMDHLKSSSGIDLRTGTGNVSQSKLNRALVELDAGGKGKMLLGPQTAQTVNKLGNVVGYTQIQAPGSYVNNSNTLVAKLKSGVKTGAEGLGNLIVPGAKGGTWLRKMAEQRAERNFVKDTIKPGAGILLSDIGK